MRIRHGLNHRQQRMADNNLGIFKLSRALIRRRFRIDAPQVDYPREFPLFRFQSMSEVLLRNETTEQPFVFPA